MSDRREEILNSIIDNHPSHGLGPEECRIAKDAMDEYMKECCLEMLQYIADKGIYVSCIRDGEVLFFYKGDFLTKEQLFENFL